MRLLTLLGLVGIQLAQIIGQTPAQLATPLKRLVEVGRRGGDADTVLSTTVRSVLPLGKGVAVLLPEEAKIVVLNERFEFVREFGRPGSGPGEFRFPSALYPADSGRLMVADIERRRISVFSDDGKLVSTISTDGFRAPIKSPWWSITALAPTADARMPIIVARGPAAPPESIAFIPASSRIAIPSRDPIRSPFVDTPAWAVPSRSQPVIHIVRVTAGSQLTVQSLSTTGQITSSVRFRVPEIPAPPTWYDAKIDSMVRSDREFRRSRAEFTRHIERPKNLPVVQRVIAGDDGSVWIQRMVPAGEPARFHVVADRRVSEVIGPVGLRVLHTNGSLVYGTVRTENGSDVLIEFRLQ